MLAIVLQFFILIKKQIIIILIMAPLVGALMSCDGANNFKKNESALASPERLPGGSGLLAIEYSDTAGQLSLLHSSTNRRSLLYSADSSNDLRMRQPIWGDRNCDEPVYFSPQSVDLAQRPSGRWQLLVVNHAIEDISSLSGAVNTVEMFELQKNDIQEWELIWRGCVETPAGIVFHDVRALQDGFLLNTSLSLFEKKIGLIKSFIGYEDEKKWSWRLQDGFQLTSVTRQP